MFSNLHFEFLISPMRAIGRAFSIHLHVVTLKNDINYETHYVIVYELLLLSSFGMMTENNAKNFSGDG
jgi:hypothetical protein